MILYFIIFYFYLGIRAGGSGGLRWDMDRRSSSSSRRSKLVLLVLVYRLVATWPAARVLARGPSAADRTFDYIISSPPPPATRLWWHRFIIQTHATDTQQKKQRKVERNEKIKRKEKERKLLSSFHYHDCVHTEPAVPSLSPDKTETRAGFFVVPLAVTRLTEFWRPDDIDFCLVWVGHLFSRYYFVLFCVFWGFPVCFGCWANSSKRSQGLGCLSVSSIFFLPGYLGQSGNGEKNYKKPAAVDFSSRRCCCATSVCVYSSSSTTYTVGKFDRCRLCKSVWLADHYGSIDSLIDVGCWSSLACAT